MPRFRSNDPWRVLWQIVTSDYLLGGVLLALALALALAAWLPQMSVSGVGDADWQAEMLRRFGRGGWSDAIRSFLQIVGAFRMTDAVGFRFLLALVALALLARFIDSVERLWQGWRGETPSERAPWAAVDGEWDELVTRLRGQRLRITEKGATGEASQEEQASVVVCADRWPWGELGPMLVYLGGLMVLAGLAVTAVWGWQIGPLSVAAGESVPLEHGSRLTLKLKELTQDGRRGAGEIWREGETLASTGRLAVGQPLAGGGVGAYLVGSRAGLWVQARLNDTQVLELATGPDEDGQKGLVLTFSKDEVRRLVSVPEANLVLHVAMPQPVQAGVLPWVQVLEPNSDQPILEQELPDDGALTVGNVSFDLMPVPCAEIQVVRDPGAFWSQLGVIGLMAGAVLRGLWPPRRLWLRHLVGGDQAPGDIEAVGDGVDELVALDV